MKDDEKININWDKVNTPNEDDFPNFYLEIDENELRAKADIYTPDSFIYQYCLSDEQRKFIDEIRSTKDHNLILKRTLDEN